MRLTEKVKNGYRSLETFQISECSDKLGKLEDIGEWLTRKRFYGRAINEPNKINELEFDKLSFRQEEDLLLIHFKVLNSWATSIFYSIFDYGKMFALTKEELEDE